MKGTLIGDFAKTLSGVCLATLFIEFIYFFEVGNPVNKWLGDRLLYMYLCHLWIIGWLSQKVTEWIWIKNHIEVGFYILFIGAIIYTEMAYFVLGKKNRL